MAPELKIVRAMFDVKPVDQSGSLDLQKISLIERRLNLKVKPVSHSPKLSNQITSPIQYRNIREDLINDLNKELKTLVIRQPKTEKKKIIYQILSDISILNRASDLVR